MKIAVRYLLKLFLKMIRKYAWSDFKELISEINSSEYLIFGEKTRLFIDPTAQVNNALFNLNSGCISIGKNSFFGHSVSLITGRHDPDSIGVNRMTNYKKEGCDIIIGDGVWIGSNATILGPCKIGDNAVVGAMSLVKSDVLPNTVAVGIPAKPLRSLTSKI